MPVPSMPATPSRPFPRGRPPRRRLRPFRSRRGMDERTRARPLRLHRRPAPRASEDGHVARRTLPRSRERTLPRRDATACRELRARVSPLRPGSSPRALPLSRPGRLRRGSPPRPLRSDAEPSRSGGAGPTPSAAGVRVVRRRPDDLMEGELLSAAGFHPHLGWVDGSLSPERVGSYVLSPLNRTRLDDVAFRRLLRGEIWRGMTIGHFACVAPSTAGAGPAPGPGAGARAWSTGSRACGPINGTTSSGTIGSSPGTRRRATPAR